MATTKLISVLVFISVIQSNVICDEILKYVGQYEIVVPVLLYNAGKKETRDLSTFDQKMNDHKDRVEFLLKTKNTSYHLDMMQNMNVHSETLQLKGDNSRFPNCHYHGKFKLGNGGAAISTCDGGLSGTIHDDDTEKTYVITKLDNGQHIIYEPANIKSDEFRSLGDPIHSKTHVHHDIKRSISDVAQNILSLEWAQEKYIEMGIVVDNAFIQTFGSPENATVKVGEIMNYADYLWGKLNIRLVLTHLELRHDEHEFLTLEEFDKYKSSELIPNKGWKVDAVHLLSTLPLNGLVGVAYFGGFCTGVPSAISTFYINSQATGAIFAHELGHNFGLSHDASSCNCSEGYCTMSRAIGPAGFQSWSDCSLKKVHEQCQNGYCLCIEKDPKRTWDGPKCGNNIVEAGEQCDCGPANTCTNPCCDAATCRHKTGVQCAHGECCENCHFKAQGIVCRHSNSECDITETCSGNHAQCPENVFVENYSSCKSDSYCHGGSCIPALDNVCQALWGPESFFGTVDECKTGELRHINMDGDRFGNCGFVNGEYVPCHFRDLACGKLQCTGPRAISRSNSELKVYQGVHKTCYSFITPFGNDVIDVTMPNDGTKCGKDKVCHQQQCIDVPLLREHVLECYGRCGSRGKCLSNGLCLCLPGYQCPNCDIIDETNTNGQICTAPPTNEKPAATNHSTCACANGGVSNIDIRLLNKNKVCDSAGHCYCKAGYGCPLCLHENKTNVNGRQCRSKSYVIDEEGVPVATCPYDCKNGGICDLHARSCICPAGRKCPDCSENDTTTMKTECEANRNYSNIECSALSGDDKLFTGQLEKYGCKFWSNANSKWTILKDLRPKIIWSSTGYNLEAIICECSHIASRSGYKFIKLQYWAECWGSNDYDFVTALANDHDCINKDYQGCKENDAICSGKDYDGMVYRVLNSRKLT